VVPHDRREVIVGPTLNAAYALRLQRDRGSIEPGKRGDLTVLAVEHPNELILAVGQNVVSSVVVGGEAVHGRRPQTPVTAIATVIATERIR
jgi:imidazolonepropionase